jgi:hypothetical protein
VADAPALAVVHVFGVPRRRLLRRTAHRLAIQRTEEEHWYAEELFARFEVLDVEGTYAGRTP